MAEASNRLRPAATAKAVDEQSENSHVRHVLINGPVRTSASSTPNLAGLICYWCKKKLAIITEPDAGGQPLSFCSTSCISAYKMSVFKLETEALLRSTPTLPEPKNPGNLSESGSPRSQTTTKPTTRAATKPSLPRTTRKRAAYPRPHPYYALNKKYWQNLKNSGLSSTAPQTNKTPEKSPQPNPPVNTTTPQPKTIVNNQQRPPTATASWQTFEPELHSVGPPPCGAFQERYLPLSPRPPNQCMAPLPPMPQPMSLLPPPAIFAPYPFLIPVPLPIPVPIPIPFCRAKTMTTNGNVEQTNSNTNGNNNNNNNNPKNGKTGFSIDQLIHKFKKQD